MAVPVTEHLADCVLTDGLAKGHLEPVAEIFLG
jgi:hypothetical protein